MDQDEVQFYKRREVQALRLADDAKMPRVEAIHREMARRYREMALEADLAGERLGAEITNRL